MKKIYNFSAGPAVLPNEAIRDTATAVVNYNDSGVSLLEMSHRSQPIVDLMEETSMLARRLLAVPDNYHIIWLQGGASTQFSMVPMNLLSENEIADYTDTGSWAAKAIKEAEAYGSVNVSCTTKSSIYNYINKDLQQSDKAIYLHITSNNTIYGTQWDTFPNTLNSEGYLVADMSSDIFSRSLDFDSIGLIYAGAQKNMGPAGVTLVIIRDDILGKVDRHIPTMLDYRIHIEKGSAFNTPPVSAIFVVNRTLHWVDDLGGVQVIEEKNKIKANKLYAEIERNLLFKSPISEKDRSLMNVPFVFSENGNEQEFLDFCAERGLMTLKGHRAVGGFRASIYNAMPEAGVDALIAAMQEYESQNN